MADELSLQTLIDNVKQDLFEPFAGSDIGGKAGYPVFFIDEVNLEISVDIQYSITGGIKVIVPQIVESSLGTGHDAGTGHKVQIKLTPILDRVERRQLLEERGVMDGVKTATLATVRKAKKQPGMEKL
jgi:hypothetical protein